MRLNKAHSGPTYRTNTTITEKRCFIGGHEYKRKGRRNHGTNICPPLFLALVLASCCRITGFPLGRQWLPMERILKCHTALLSILDGGLDSI